MKWTEIEKALPSKPGFYQCYFPESEIYSEHHSERWFDGNDFRYGASFSFTDARMKGKKINKYISHWMKIERPI